MSKKEIKESTFYVVHSWMNTRLQLKGAERDMFAIILGYSQDDESYYYGSLDYASRLTGYSKPAIIEALKALVEKDYIIRDQLSSQKVRYKVNLDAVETSKLSLPDQNETSKLSLQDINETSKLSLQNNKYTNINKNNSYKLNPFKYVQKEDLNPILVAQETDLSGSEGFDKTIAPTAQRKSSERYPTLSFSDDELDELCEKYSLDRVQATLDAMNELNLTRERKFWFAPGIKGFESYVEKYGLAQKKKKKMIRARLD